MGDKPDFNSVDEFESTWSAEFVPGDRKEAIQKQAVIQEESISQTDSSVAAEPEEPEEDDFDRTVGVFDVFQQNAPVRKEPSPKPVEPPKAPEVRPPEPPKAPEVKAVEPPKVPQNNYSGQRSPVTYGPSVAPVVPAETKASNGEETIKKKRLLVFILTGVLAVIGTVALISAGPACIAFYAAIPFLYLFIWPGLKKKKEPDQPEGY